MTNILLFLSVVLLSSIPECLFPDGNDVIDVYEGFQKKLLNVRSGKVLSWSKVSPIVGLVSLFIWPGNTGLVKKSKWKKKIPIEIFANISLKMSERKLDQIQKKWKKPLTSVKFAESPFLPRLSISKIFTQTKGSRYGAKLMSFAIPLSLCHNASRRKCIVDGRRCQVLVELPGTSVGMLENSVQNVFIVVQFREAAISG